jgi:hypothetical protein
MSLPRGVFQGDEVRVSRSTAQAIAKHLAGVIPRFQGVRVRASWRFEFYRLSRPIDA